MIDSIACTQLRKELKDLFNFYRPIAFNKLVFIRNKTRRYILYG